MSAPIMQSAVIEEEFVYESHNSPINTLCYNHHQNVFVSTDDTSMRLWGPTKGEIRHVALPSRTTNFIQAMEYIDSRQCYIAAALDGSLKMYDQNLSELVSVHSGRGTILCMIYDTKRHHLLTGGVDGCAAWLIRGKSMDQYNAETMTNPHYEISPLPFFFHTLHHTVQHSNQPTVQYVGVTNVSNHHEHKTMAQREMKLPASKTWTNRIKLNGEKSKIYALSKDSIDVYNADDGRHLDRFSGMFPEESGAIKDFVLHEKTQYLVCGCMSGSIFVVCVQPMGIVCQFRDHTKSVSSLALHEASGGLILSSSLDGTIILWDIEARRQVHRQDMTDGKSVHSLTLIAGNTNSGSGNLAETGGTWSSGPCRFFCRVRNVVHLFQIKSTIKEHMSCLSPVSILQRFIVLDPKYYHHQKQLQSLHQNQTQNQPIEKKFSSILEPNKVIVSQQELEMEAALTSDATEWSSNRGVVGQYVVAAGMDKTIRIFSRRSHEAPIYTWIPDKSLDMIGFGLNPMSKKLYLLLESHKILVSDFSQVENDLSGEAVASIYRTIHFDTKHLRSICCCTFAPIFWSSMTACSTVGSGTSTTSVPHLRRLSTRLSISTNGPMRPPAVHIGNSNPASPTSAAAAAAFGRSKRSLGILFNQKSFAMVKGTRTLQGGLFDSMEADPDLEWIVCGSETGQLLFWNSSMSNNFGKEAIQIDAHDSAIVSILQSTSTPLLVSLDADKKLHVWHTQPKFNLVAMTILPDMPTCLVMSPCSEMLLCGYEDGTVVLLDLGQVTCSSVGTISGEIEFFTSEQNHLAMICGGDFLDELGICLSASIDANIKVWDQNKNLLRELSVSMAFSSLSFMNSFGDLMTGLQDGIFVITKNHILPEKLPTKKKNLLGILKNHQKHKQPKKKTKNTATNSSTGSFVKDQSQEVVAQQANKNGREKKHEEEDEEEDSEKEMDVGSLLAKHEAQLRCQFQKVNRLEQEQEQEQEEQQKQKQQPKTNEPPKDQATGAMNVETRDSIGATGQKTDLKMESYLAVLNRPVETCAPPVCQPILPPKSPTNIPTNSEIPENSSYQYQNQEDQLTDWREPDVKTSMLLIQTIAANKASKPLSSVKTSRHTVSKTRGPEQTKSPRVTTRALKESTTQAPSQLENPPTSPKAQVHLINFDALSQAVTIDPRLKSKKQTTRKLWNAIGGEDRRLIAIQQSYRRRPRSSSSSNNSKA